MNEAALLAARRDKTAVERGGLRRGDRSRHRRPRKEARDEPARAPDRRVPRVRPRDRRDRAARPRSGPQGVDRRSAASARSATRCSCRRGSLPAVEDATSNIELAVLLGGRTAEAIVFDEISTGAQNDLLRATDIARAMVTEFGMSDSDRPGQPRGPPAQHVPRHAVRAPSAAPTPRRPRGHRLPRSSASSRRPKRRAQRAAHRAPRDRSTRSPASAGEGSDRRRRAARRCSACVAARPRQASSNRRVGDAGESSPLRFDADYPDLAMPESR